MPENKATKIDMVSVGEIKPNPRNPNKHGADQIERLAKIISVQGFRNPLIVSKQSGLLVVGHGRLMAAKQAGFTEVPVIFEDFDSDDLEYAAMVADNGLQLWSELDLSAINADLQELDGLNFDIDLLGIKDFTVERADKNDNDPDATPDPVAEPKVKSGELWILGNHRLLIGDCTVKENVERLMAGEKADMVFTDPPYGIDLDTDYGKSRIGELPDGRKVYRHSYRKVEGDAVQFNPTTLSHIIDDHAEVFLFGGNYFMPPSPKNSYVCWDKKCQESGDESKIGDFELCWSKKRHKNTMVRATWYGPFGHNKKNGCAERVHPTQKPVKLWEIMFEKFKPGDVLDPFLGSGSTLIACEKTNRRCFGMEIDAAYGQVIIERWQKYTGKEAIREDGTAFNSP